MIIYMLICAQFFLFWFTLHSPFPPFLFLHRVLPQSGNPRSQLLSLLPQFYMLLNAHTRVHVRSVCIPVSAYEHKYLHVQQYLVSHMTS